MFKTLKINDGSSYLANRIFFCWIKSSLGNFIFPLFSYIQGAVHSWAINNNKCTTNCGAGAPGRLSVLTQCTSLPSSLSGAIHLGRVRYCPRRSFEPSRIMLSDLCLLSCSDDDRLYKTSSSAYCVSFVYDPPFPYCTELKRRLFFFVIALFDTTIVIWVKFGILNM